MEGPHYALEVIDSGLSSRSPRQILQALPMGLPSSLLSSARSVPKGLGQLCPHLKQSFRLFFTAFLAIAVAPESGVLFGVSSGPRAAVGRGWQGSLSVQALSRDFVLEATKLLTWSPP